MASSSDRGLLIHPQLALMEKIKWHRAAGHGGKTERTLYDLQTAMEPWSSEAGIQHQK